MKLAILIQAHKNPEQVARLCNRLSHPSIDLYVNVDTKADIEAYRAIIPDAFFIKDRTNIKWSRFTLTEAPLKALSEIFASGKKYDYFHFISGQDYPLVPMDYFLDQLGANPETEYLDCSPTDQEGEFWRKIRKHYERYYYKYRQKPMILTQAVNGIFKLPFMKRKPPVPMYFGSAWWTLTSDCVEYVLAYCRRNPKFVRFFRGTFCGDELLFQSVIGNSEFALRPNPGYKRHIDWSAQKRNPKTLLTEDFEKLTTGGAWFARKFDETLDREILALLDKHIDNYPAAQSLPSSQPEEGSAG